MAEKIYTIPVNEAFDKHSECPVCTMYQRLEDDSVEYVLGSSYMDEDIRTETNIYGFCRPHMKILSVQQNRLGLALILKTHVDEMKKQALKEAKKPIKPKSMLKKVEDAPLGVWALNKSKECFMCNRINVLFPRYVDTIIHLYKKDPDFRKKYESCKGFCLEHFGMLILKAQEKMDKNELPAFVELTTRLYTENLERLSEDLDWFSVKYDYRFKGAPWKNARDSIERAITKTNSIVPSELKN